MAPDLVDSNLPLTALDSHVHLYPGAAPAQILASGWRNLVAATADRQNIQYGLLLTETSRDDAFAALAAGQLSLPGWSAHPIPEDPAALRVERRADGATLLLTAGRQIVTREGIEVLALATHHRLADGQPIRAVLSNLKDHGVPTVLPWGLGKWIGARGAQIAALLSEAKTWSFLLGDNAGRPVGTPTPKPFRTAAKMGVPILPGTDPLPLLGSENEVGRYGFLLDGYLDVDRPSEDLRARLLSLQTQPTVIGKRRGPLAVLSEQIALRRNRANANAGQVKISAG